MLDLRKRGRICVLGNDREKFIHGQVTNDVTGLKPGSGCYAALVNAKGRIQSDLFIYKLENELLLDFEPGLSEQIQQRLEKFVIAEDVQVVDVANTYSLLALEGPNADSVLRKSGFSEVPLELLSWTKSSTGTGDIYIMRNDRFGVMGYDIFFPLADDPQLESLFLSAGAMAVGETATDTVRIEHGIPRFGVDMDDSNLASETGIQSRAISYAKGCYIGQEVIARIRTYGQVAKSLRLLQLSGKGALPVKGTSLRFGGKEVGYITSSAESPRYDSRVALGYVRKECNNVGTALAMGESQEAATIIGVPGEIQL